MADPHYDFSRTEIRPFVPVGATTLLDVGCGGGAFVRGLKVTHPDCEMWGIEPDADSADAAGRSVFQQVVHAPFPEGVAQLSRSSFDVVCFNDVLEHVMDPVSALRAAGELLSEGGTVIASIPNVRHFSVVWDLVRRGSWNYGDYGILDRTHVKFFTRKTMIELFESAGLRVSSVQGINRCRWPEVGSDTWKTRGLSAITRGGSDPFFFVQYALTATR